MEEGKQPPPPKEPAAAAAPAPAKKPDAAAAAPSKKPDAITTSNTARSGPTKMVEAAVNRVKDQGKQAMLLCDTKLADLDVAFLAPTVKTTTWLRSLSFYGCNLSLSSAKLLADALASHESLTMLDLGQNELGAQGVEAVCNALIHNSFLRTLGLASTKMGDQGATAMAHVMRINSCLTEVYLNSNGIQQEGANELAGALLFNDSARLRSLYLYGNHVGEEGVAEFRKLLGDCPTVDERVPLDSEKALALAMGTHPRLGATSPVVALAREPTVREGVKKTKRSLSLLKVVRECCAYRSVKRGIYGLEDDGYKLASGQSVQEEAAAEAAKGGGGARGDPNSPHGNAEEEEAQGLCQASVCSIVCYELKRKAPACVRRMVYQAFKRVG